MYVVLKRVEDSWNYSLGGIIRMKKRTKELKNMGRPVANKNVKAAEEIVRAALEPGGDSTLKRLHEEKDNASLPWVAFEEVKENWSLITVRNGDGRLMWIRQ